MKLTYAALPLALVGTSFAAPLTANAEVKMALRNAPSGWPVNHWGPIDHDKLAARRIPSAITGVLASISEDTEKAEIPAEIKAFLNQQIPDVIRAMGEKAALGAMVTEKDVKTYLEHYEAAAKTFLAPVEKDVNGFLTKHVPAVMEMLQTEGVVAKTD